MEIKELKKKALDLLAQVEKDKWAEYNDDWRRKAIGILNEFYAEILNDSTLEILDKDDSLLENILREKLEHDGVDSVKIFLQDMELGDCFVRIDAYGTATTYENTFVEDLKDMLAEIDRQESEA